MGKYKTHWFEISFISMWLFYYFMGLSGAIENQTILKYVWAGMLTSCIIMIMTGVFHTFSYEKPEKTSEGSEEWVIIGAVILMIIYLGSALISGYLIGEYIIGE